PAVPKAARLPVQRDPHALHHPAALVHHRDHAELYVGQVVVARVGRLDSAGPRPRLRGGPAWPPPRPPPYPARRAPTISPPPARRGGARSVAARQRRWSRRLIAREVVAQELHNGCRSAPLPGDLDAMSNLGIRWFRFTEEDLQALLILRDHGKLQ